MAVGHDRRALRPLVGRRRRPRTRPPRCRRRSPRRRRSPTGSAWSSPRCGPATRSATTVASPSVAARRRHAARHPRRGAPARRRARRSPSTTGSLARRLWTRVSPLEPTTRRVRALDRALSLLADHELATSTFGGAGRGVDVGRPVPAAPHRAGDRRRTTARRRVGVRARAPARRGHDRSPSTQSAARCATTSSCPASGTRSTRDPIHGRRCSSTRSSRPGHRATLWRAAHGRARGDGPRRRAAPQHRLRARRARPSRCAWSTAPARRCSPSPASAGWIAHGLEEYQHRLRYRIRATYTGPEQLGN